MKKLRAQLAMVLDLVAKDAALQDQEIQHTRNIDHLTNHGDHERDEDLRKLSQAQAHKMLISQKRKKLAIQIANASEEFRLIYQEARRNWDRFVVGKREETFNQLLKAVEPFFGGPEKAALTRRELEAMHVPARDAINSALSPDFSTHSPSIEDYVNWTQFLLDHAARYAEDFGWGDPDQVQPSPRVIRESFVPSDTKMLKVKARQTVALPALGTRPGLKGKPTHVIKEGTEMEISERAYHALSRFFELV